MNIKMRQSIDEGVKIRKNEKKEEEEKKKSVKFRETQN